MGDPTSPIILIERAFLRLISNMIIRIAVRSVRKPIPPTISNMLVGWFVVVVLVVVLEVGV